MQVSGLRAFTSYLISQQASFHFLDGLKISVTESAVVNVGSTTKVSII